MGNKIKVTVYLEEGTKQKLDKIYTWCIGKGSKRPYGEIITEGIETMHDVIEEKIGFGDNGPAPKVS